MRLAILCCFVLACGGGIGKPRGPSQAADFTLPDLGGRNVRLSDLDGKVVVLNFWATWCVPCTVELPHLERMYKAHKDRGLVVLAISMDGPESAAQVESFARRYRLSLPVLLDTETRVTGNYNPTRAAPYNVLIGRDGVVAMKKEGYRSGDEVALEASIQKLLEAPAQ